MILSIFGHNHMTLNYKALNLSAVDPRKLERCSPELCHVLMRSR